MPTNIRGKLTEPSGESKIRSPSVQELDLISGGFRVPFGGGNAWIVHKDGGVTLQSPGRDPITFNGPEWFGVGVPKVPISGVLPMLRLGTTVRDQALGHLERRPVLVALAT